MKVACVHIRRAVLLSQTACLSCCYCLAPKEQSLVVQRMSSMRRKRWEGGLESEGNLAQEDGTFPNCVSSTCQEVILEQHDVLTLGRNKGRKRNLGCSLSSVLLWNLIAHFTVHENQGILLRQFSFPDMMYLNGLLLSCVLGAVVPQSVILGGRLAWVLLHLLSAGLTLLFKAVLSAKVWPCCEPALVTLRNNLS